MVLQEPFLFSRTIRDNIAAANPDATMNEIREAARIACVDDAIMAFPDGYDTIVGERGVTLSGGEFDWGGRLRKSIGGAQRFPQNGWKPSTAGVVSQHRL